MCPTMDATILASLLKAKQVMLCRWRRFSRAAGPRLFYRWKRVTCLSKSQMGESRSVRVPGRKWKRDERRCYERNGDLAQWARGIDALKIAAVIWKVSGCGHHAHLSTTPAITWRLRPEFAETILVLLEHVAHPQAAAVRPVPFLQLPEAGVTAECHDAEGYWSWLCWLAGYCCSDLWVVSSGLTGTMGLSERDEEEIRMCSSALMKASTERGGVERPRRANNCRFPSPARLRRLLPHRHDDVEKAGI